jgi:ABC-2 type transport system ATP-binding protein
MAVIEVRDLVKKYGTADNVALNNINLSITEGDFFGLLGPNAAGKTTLISVISGLLKITSGDVFVKNVNVKLNPAAIKKHIGLIPQDLALYPVLTIRENLEFFGRMHGLFGKTLSERIDEYLDVVQLSGNSNKKVSECSGGIKRRANLIAGLLHQPSIVFLDEPTLGVDAQSRNLIFEYLQELNKRGVTCIYTTHYMEEAELLCSGIMIIDNGCSIAEGSPKELISRNEGCTDLGQVFLKLTGKQLRD